MVLFVLLEALTSSIKLWAVSLSANMILILLPPVSSSFSNFTMTNSLPVYFRMISLISSSFKSFFPNTISTYSEGFSDSDDEDDEDSAGFSGSGEDDEDFSGSECFSGSGEDNEDPEGISVHCAVTVTSSAGILSGLGDHPLKVCPSFVGFAG